MLIGACLIGKDVDGSGRGLMKGTTIPGFVWRD
jgi:hypothetical protein